MDKIKFKGKVTKILPKKEFKNKEGQLTGSKSREFWVEEINDDRPDAKYKPVFPFEIYSKPGAEHDFTDFLDNLKIGYVVKFDWVPIASKPWTNQKTGETRIFTTLRVVGKIETLSKDGSSASDAPAPASPSEEPVSYDDVGEEMPF